MNQPNGKQSNQSSVRLLQIMECMASNRAPMRLQEIAQLSGLTQSTALRYLYTLKDEGYVYQEEETLRYGLTWKICRISDQVHCFLSFRNIANSFVNLLANELSLGSCLVVAQNNECMYLDCIDNPNTPTMQRIGKRAALHATGSGKVLLSDFSELQLNQYIRDKGLIPFTEYTITDPARLREELDLTRRRGYAMDEEECELGLRCVSMPIRDYSSRVCAAMSVFGRPEDMTDERIETEILPILKKATGTISGRLGYGL